ncbi:hypothetical protein EQO05_03385 [Methanosarcina sp. MSH10X1]|uniref:hypothetical protein n=1 Tax=Methanosarcina sp. MSH10X1 TaxID=2507075 RepID=UPI000FFB4D8C|nr:hypothetical protein [Methanosarcina sp. MSH10X1]RXA20786.1 hypothetical protein EQO05_03385 [Methanosarcina sp. MSH10X1]
MTLSGLHRIGFMAPVDVTIRYKPDYSELILAQVQEFSIISGYIENTTYNGSSMAALMQITSLNGISWLP